MSYFVYCCICAVLVGVQGYLARNKTSKQQPGADDMIFTFFQKITANAITIAAKLCKSNLYCNKIAIKNIAGCLLNESVAIKGN
jgi:hypothetical protein